MMMAIVVVMNKDYNWEDNKEVDDDVKNDWLIDCKYIFVYLGVDRYCDGWLVCVYGYSICVVMYFFDFFYKLCERY